MSGLKKQTYLEGAAVLLIANALVKVIGAIFKIPLANIIGEEGMAVFNTAYTLYATLFSIATAGLPVAVSKMISESLAHNNYTEVKRIFRSALLLLFSIGILGALALFFGARYFSDVVLKSTSSYLGIIAISPAILFVTVVSAFRGYFQGHSNMTPTGMSEVAEALGKLIVGLGLSVLLIKSSVINAAAGAILGVTGGTLFACIIMIVMYFITQKNEVHTLKTPDSAARSSKTLFKKLLFIAVPITIGATVFSLTSLIDMVMIRRRLQTILIDSAWFDTLTKYYGVPVSGGTEAYVKIGEYMSEKASDILYGSYSGYAIPMFNLPPTLVMSLTMSVVPAISSAFAVKNMRGARTISESTLRITLMITLPCAFGLSVLSGPILTAVYNNMRASTMLFVLAFAVIFVSVVSVTTAMLQATGNELKPVKNMFIGAVVKIVTNFILIGIPQININGAPISTNICYLTIMILNLRDIARVLKPSLTARDYIFKPVLCSLVMSVFAYFLYNLTAGFMNIPKNSLVHTFMPSVAPVTPVDTAIRLKVAIALGIAMLVGIIAYTVALFVTKSIKREDVIMLPKGNALAKMLDKFNLLA